MNERMCSSCVGRVEPGALGIENMSVLLQHSLQTLEHEKQSKTKPCSQCSSDSPNAVGGALGQCILGSRSCPGAEVGAHLLLVLSEAPARSLGGPGTLSSPSVVALLILTAPHLPAHSPATQGCDHTL